MAPPRKASQEQLEQILGFMEENPHVSTEGCKPEFKKSWKTLADTLNTMKSGAIKTPEKWSKCWNDWKFFVRKKAHKNIKMIGVEARLFEFLQKYGRKDSVVDVSSPSHDSSAPDSDAGSDYVVQPKRTRKRKNLAHLTTTDSKRRLRSTKKDDALGPIKSKTSKEQLGILLNFMESQRMLSKSTDRPVTNWQKFTNVLNKLDSGTVKRPDDWEKCWHDWQKWVAKKASRNPDDPTSHMSAMETRVWSLMGDYQKDVGNIKRESSIDLDYTDIQEAVVVHDPLVANDDNIKFFDEVLNDNHDDAASNRNDEGNSDEELNENETVESLLRNEQRRLEIEEAKLRIKEKRLKLEEKRLQVEERRNDILERIDEKLGSRIFGRMMNDSNKSPLYP